MYSFIRANKIKTWAIVILFVVITGLVGTAISYVLVGSPTYTIPTLIFAAGYALVQYYMASRIALSMSGAKEVTNSKDRLYRIVENLAITEGMPMPKVYVTPDQGLNAFATGRDPDHAHVAATAGILEALDDAELEGVMAHELSHVKNYDIRVSMIVMGLAMALALVADLGSRMMFFGGSRQSNDRDNSGGLVVFIAVFAAMLAPLIGRVIQAAVSRQREYLADATAVQITRYPDGLASALHKLAGGKSQVRTAGTSNAHLYISNPLRPSKMLKWFDTHPPLPDRINRIHQIGTQL